MDSLNQTLNVLLKPLKSNDIGMSLLKLSLVLYGGLAAPSLPPQFKQLFDNPVVKTSIFFLILYVNQKDPRTALISIMAFMTSIRFLNKKTLEPFHTQCIHHQAFSDKSTVESGLHNVKLLVSLEDKE
jgi:hypothetical protein